MQDQTFGIGESLEFILKRKEILNVTIQNISAADISIYFILHQLRIFFAESFYAMS